MKVTVIDKKLTPGRIGPGVAVTLICRDQAGGIIEVDPFITAMALEDDEQAFANKAIGKAFQLSGDFLCDGVHIPTGFQPGNALGAIELR